ncbi:MAG: porin [Pseudomonadota bacterium]
MLPRMLRYVSASTSCALVTVIPFALFALLLSLIAGSASASAAPTAEASAAEPGVAADSASAEPQGGYEWGRGLVFRSGETDLWLGGRAQLRFNSSTTELDRDRRVTESDIRSMDVERARIKGGGKVIRRWLDLYGEYDLVGSQWLDYRATFRIGDWLDLRAGQWKSEFSRERVNSSGRQQLVERSIVNYWFTIDRQHGISTSARFGAGSRADVRLWVQALSGLGINRASERSKGLLLTRLQWYPDGSEMPFSGSDVERRKDRVSSVALAYVTGDTRCSRFSSDGCGQLPGLEESDYDLEQVMLETALKHRGFSWEQELHYKRLRDERTGAVQRVVGGYAQLGTFLSEWWSGAPEPLEVVARFALVDPDTEQSSDLNEEYTLGLNWFIEGHRNKLSLDLSRLEAEDAFGEVRETRLRLQWDVSF